MAIRWFKKSVAIDPKYGASWKDLGSAYGILGKNKKMRKYHKKAAELGIN
jgi:Tfp pilus assembly protein PilF